MRHVERFGCEVRRIRLERGLSVRELSEMSGVKEATIRKLEAGNDVMAVVLFQLCRGLGVTPVFSDQTLLDLKMPTEEDYMAALGPCGK